MIYSEQITDRSVFLAAVTTGYDSLCITNYSVNVAYFRVANGELNAITGEC